MWSRWNRNRVYFLIKQSTFHVLSMTDQYKSEMGLKSRIWVHRQICPSTLSKGKEEMHAELVFRICWTLRGQRAAFSSLLGAWDGFGINLHGALRILLLRDMEVPRLSQEPLVFSRTELENSCVSPHTLTASLVWLDSKLQWLINVPLQITSCKEITAASPLLGSSEISSVTPGLKLYLTFPSYWTKTFLLQAFRCRSCFNNYKCGVLKASPKQMSHK